MRSSFVASATLSTGGSRSTVVADVEGEGTSMRELHWVSGDALPLLHAVCAGPNSIARRSPGHRKPPPRRVHPTGRVSRKRDAGVRRESRRPFKARQAGGERKAC